jgi:hypothetical protein
MKNKKIIIYLIILLVGTSFCTIQASAHPPQDMTLEYNLNTQQLNVTITHETPAPTVHYVYKIDIKKNDELIITESYSSQPSNSIFTYTYTVESNIGDTIEATAYCNIAGTITKSLIVKDPSEDTIPPIIEIINPKEGYFHFSGIPIIPNPFSFIAETMSPGGFRLGPISISAEDNIDQPEDLVVKIFIDGEQRGIASWNPSKNTYQWKWTGIGLGVYQLRATASDTSSNTASAEMQVWYFCFIP